MTAGKIHRSRGEDDIRGDAQDDDQNGRNAPEHWMRSLHDCLAPHLESKTSGPPGRRGAAYGRLTPYCSAWGFEWWQPVPAWADTPATVGQLRSSAFCFRSSRKQVTRGGPSCSKKRARSSPPKHSARASLPTD